MNEQHFELFKYILVLGYKKAHRTLNTTFTRKPF